MNRRLRSFAIAVVVLSSTPVVAEVRVAALIGDHMVVQRKMPIRLWGTATARESVEVSLAGHSGTTQADSKGLWSLTLPALEAGGPHTLAINGTNALRFTDVWVGEVWVGSGQSNMEWPLAQSNAAADAVAAGCEGLRLFTVTKATAGEPARDVEGSWVACDEKAALAFSAVAFHFGRELQRTLGVAIGLIHSSWGGTPAEAWTPRQALVAEESLKPLVDELDEAIRNPVAREEVTRKLAEWEARNFHQDTGNTGVTQGFAGVDAPAAGWSKMELPQFWEGAGPRIDGAVWFRREVIVPADWAGRELALSLGPIDDFDTTYWNGESVGATGKETTQYWAAPRRYTVPGRFVKAGRNVVAVRVFDHYGNGGFGGAPAQMAVVPTRGGGEALSLAGAWDYRIERGLEPATADFSTRPEALGIDNPNSATVLWNAMMAPLAPFPLAGAIWYQGEANASRARQYRLLFPVMIHAWREAWSQPELPFLFVQLANHHPLAMAPGDSEWAELREAQALALRLPKTGMAVALDIGEADDIHPRNKKDVGLRLALQALRTVYGQELAASGPTFRAATRESATLRISFDNLGGGLVTLDGSAPQGFAVAGADRKWRWAEARIEGDSLVVSSAEVPEPMAVRYGWADNPPNNLRNKAGLPAAPFRSDDWPGITASH